MPPADPVVDGRIALAGPWRFAIGDDVAWAAPGFDDSGWSTIRVPDPWGAADPSLKEYSGFAWYRRDVDVTGLPADRPLGVSVGWVASAYELYVDGTPVGGVGELPPGTRVGFDVPAVLPIPPSAAADGHVVLAFRVWQPPGYPATMGGLEYGEPRIGALEVLEREVIAHDIPLFATAAVTLAAAAYHALLWTRRRERVEYLWFAALGFGVTAFVVGRGQALKELDWAAVKRAQYAGQALIPVLSVLFTQRAFDRKSGLAERIYGAISVAMAVASLTLPMPTLVRITMLNSLLQIPAFVWYMVLAAQAWWRRHPDAWLLGPAVALSPVAPIHDTLVFQGVLHGALFAQWSFLLVLAAMAQTLSNRWQRVHDEVDVLNRDLERRVADRTAELAVANQALADFNRELADRVRTQVQELVRRARLDRYMSRELLDRVLLAEDDLPERAEKRLVTILFADLTGFTALSDRLDPDLVAELLNEYLAAMIETVEAHGGTLDKLMGDGVMALYGAPRELEPTEQARRAVGLATAMHARVAALSASWATRGHGAELHLRIGIHQDDVVVGHFGSQGRVTYTAIGRGVNLASRLESNGVTGRTQVSDTVHDRVPELAFEGPRTLQVKGIRGDVRAWLVAAAP
jgi:class 3 adenylate cyclase